MGMLVSHYGRFVLRFWETRALQRPIIRSWSYSWEQPAPMVIGLWHRDDSDAEWQGLIRHETRC
jgi:hypothetical protein